MVTEPEARNTAPAIGLAAFLLARIAPDAIIGMFPADHVIGERRSFAKYCAGHRNCRRSEDILW